MAQAYTAQSDMTQDDMTECITKQHNAAQRDTAQHSRNTQNHSSTSQQHNSLLFSLLTPTDQTSVVERLHKCKNNFCYLSEKNKTKHMDRRYGSALQFGFCIHFDCRRMREKDTKGVKGGCWQACILLSCLVLVLH